MTVWGNQAESCSQFLSKGRPVAIDGRLDWREWDAQDGTKRQAVEIIADSVQFLGSREDGEGGGERQFVPASAGAGAGRTPTSARPPTTTSPSKETRWHHRAERDSKRAQARPAGAPGGPIRRRNCYFCRDKVDEVDYKNYNQLRRYISEKGKIRSRRITGACRRHQRQVAVAVKRAREMALLPYVSG